MTRNQKSLKHGSVESGAMNQDALYLFQKRVTDIGLNGFLVSHVPNIRYLTGFRGSSALLLVKKRRCQFVTDVRYAEQSRNEVKNCDISISSNRSMAETLFNTQSNRKLGKIGFEEQYLPYRQYLNTRKFAAPAKLLPCSFAVEKQMEVKSKHEIDAIRRAVEISDSVFTHLLTIIRSGISEMDLAAEITYEHLKRGAEGDAFLPIVLSGVRSSLIHGRPSTKKIRRGELILLDFGCVVDGYRSDMTRTVALGKVSSEIRNIHHIVCAAQRKAVESIQIGLNAKTLDEIARTYIDENGYGNFFGHALGHGLGMEVHGLPRISSLSSDRLRQGNVITVEPGIYVEGLGGVRVEDVVAISEVGIEILTRSSKELLTL